MALALEAGADLTSKTPDSIRAAEFHLHHDRPLVLVTPDYRCYDATAAIAEGVGYPATTRMKYTHPPATRKLGDGGTKADSLWWTWRRPLGDVVAPDRRRSPTARTDR
jgi:hypothetical protein